jgi:hypothetical protein
MPFYKEPNFYSVAWFAVWIEVIKDYILDVFVLKILIDKAGLLLCE